MAASSGAGTADIHIPIAQRIGDGFTHGLEAGEVDHRFDRVARLGLR